MKLQKWAFHNHLGSMEGKEVRFGPAASAYWGVTTTVTSNGSVNAMHDSFTPLSGMSCFAWHDDQFILWWCWCWLSQFLHLYHHCCFYRWFDGRKNTGVFRKKSRSKGNEDRFHYCIAASIAYSCRHCIVIIYVCASIQRNMQAG